MLGRKVPVGVLLEACEENAIRYEPLRIDTKMYPDAEGVAIPSGSGTYH